MFHTRAFRIPGSFILGCGLMWPVAAEGNAAGGELHRPRFHLAYRLDPIDPPPGSHGQLFLTGINSAGVIVGGFSRANDGSVEDVRLRPARWNNGVPTELPILPGGAGLNAGAGAINDHGVVVGSSTYPGAAPPFGLFNTHAVVWHGLAITDLGTLPGHDASVAAGINNAGVVVGQSAPFLNPFTEGHAVRWAGHGIVDLGVLPAEFSSQANAINRWGVAAGTSGHYDEFFFDVIGHAVRWGPAATAPQALPLSAGDGASTGDGIDDDGRIVGSAGPLLELVPEFPEFLLYEPHATVWTGMQPHRLGELPGDNVSRARATNCFGVAIGSSGTLIEDPNDPDFATYRFQPVVWILGRPKAFDSMISIHSQGWQGISLSAINASGKIVGTGLFNGEARAFVATPTFEQ